jgi:microcystin-dependent protein
MLNNLSRSIAVLVSASTLLLGLGVNKTAMASEAFLAEIKMFAGTFAPRGYAYCDGQLLPINSYQALFSLLGTTYGGDGRTTFALPDLRGRVAIHAGTGPGLSTYRLGQRGGAENVTLNTSQIPSHNHTASTDLTIAATLKADAGTGDNDAPEANVLARKNRTKIYSGDAPNVSMHADSIEMAASATTIVGNMGGSQAHENRMPFLTINYIIALEGIYPSRN